MQMYNMEFGVQSLKICASKLWAQIKRGISYRECFLHTRVGIITIEPINQVEENLDRVALRVNSEVSNQMHSFM